MLNFIQPRISPTVATRPSSPSRKPTRPIAVLICAARHLYCAAGDLAVMESADPILAARLGRLKGRLRACLIHEAGAEDLIRAAPRLVTRSGPSWSLLDAVAATLTERSVAEMEDAIDPALVALSATYLKGTNWAFEGD